MDTAELLKHIRSQFKLNWRGIHGAPHWSRVLDNGLRLAERTSARSDVITLFAFLHDSRRVDDGTDHGHGQRAANTRPSCAGAASRSMTRASCCSPRHAAATATGSRKRM